MTTVYYEGCRGSVRCFYGEPYGRIYIDFMFYTLKEIEKLLRDRYGWSFSKFRKCG